MVEGETLSREEADAPGWRTALSKNKRSSRQQESVSTQSDGTAGRRTANAQGVVRRLATASRLPRLPRSHIRVIVRPKGGLDLKKVSQIRLAQALATAAKLPPEESKEDIICPNLTQNILVVSTPEPKNAGAYAALRLIRLGSTEYQVSAYTAASDDTCKGVVRGVDVDIGEQQLAAMIVNQRNPKAMEVRRIKETTTVVVLFSGLKVPNYVMCGTSMLRCTLYMRQTDVCYGCGALGHRADVCPTPTKKVCRGCGVSDPAEDHQCQAKCALCGGGTSNGRQGLQTPLPSPLRGETKKTA